jgi:Flp pilus assembly pilin Flp
MLEQAQYCLELEGIKAYNTVADAQKTVDVFIAEHKDANMAEYVLIAISVAIGAYLAFHALGGCISAKTDSILH